MTSSNKTWITLKGSSPKNMENGYVNLEEVTANVQKIQKYIKEKNYSLMSA